MGVNIVRSVPAHCHPLVKELFSIMRDRELSYEDIGQKSGVGAGTLWNMRSRYGAKVATLDACFNVIGFRLTIVPLIVEGAPVTHEFPR